MPVACRTPVWILITSVTATPTMSNGTDFLFIYFFPYIKSFLNLMSGSSENLTGNYFLICNRRIIAVLFLLDLLSTVINRSYLSCGEQK